MIKNFKTVTTEHYTQHEGPFEYGAGCNCTGRRPVNSALLSTSLVPLPADATNTHPSQDSQVSSLASLSGVGDDWSFWGRDRGLRSTTPFFFLRSPF